jgi:hypothetical protein
MGRTYNDQVAAGTLMRGSHVRVLRTYIEEDLNAASVEFNWTWSNWPASQDPSTVIRAVYFKEMRDAIQALWDSKGRGSLPKWTQDSPGGPSIGTTATPIRASHITDLRAWLNQYEGNHPLLSQGVDSKCYDAADGRFPLISDVSGNDWTSDIKDLSSAHQRLYIRLRITAPLDPDHPQDGYTVDLSSDSPPGRNDYANYLSAFLQYKDQNMIMFPLFTLSFYQPYGYNISATLESDHQSPNYFTNDYTRGYADRVVQFMQYVISHDSSINDLIVWNEPNNLPPSGNKEYMEEKYFAALLYTTWNKVQSSSFVDSHGNSVSKPNVYWGGIFTLSDNDYPSQITYLKNVYNEIDKSGVMAGRPKPYPWEGINVHMHRDREKEQVHEIMKQVSVYQKGIGDYGDLVIGEWGVTEEDGPDKMSALYGKINQVEYPNDKYPPNVMFYFSHHVHIEAGTGTWGLRDYAILPSTPTGDWKYTLQNKVPLMWDRFRSIMNPNPWEAS